MDVIFCDSLHGLGKAEDTTARETGEFQVEYTVHFRQISLQQHAKLMKSISKC